MSSYAFRNKYGVKKVGAMYVKLECNPAIMFNLWFMCEVVLLIVVFILNIPAIIWFNVGFFCNLLKYL